MRKRFVDENATKYNVRLLNNTQDAPPKKRRRNFYQNAPLKKLLYFDRYSLHDIFLPNTSSISQFP